MNVCPTCGGNVTATETEGVKSFKATLAPLTSLSEMLGEISDSVVDQYTAGSTVSRK